MNAKNLHILLEKQLLSVSLGVRDQHKVSLKKALFEDNLTRIRT